MSACSTGPLRAGVAAAVVAALAAMAGAFVVAAPDGASRATSAAERDARDRRADGEDGAVGAEEAQLAASRGRGTSSVRRGARPMRPGDSQDLQALEAFEPRSNESPSPLPCEPARDALADDALLPSPFCAPRAGTERAFEAEFRHLAAGGGDAGAAGAVLAARAASVMGPGHSQPERVALLSVLWEVGGPGADEWFQRTLLAAPESASPPSGCASLPEFALGFLERRCARDPAALALLARSVREPALDAALRRRAILAVAEFGSREQLAQLSTDLATVCPAAESDTELLSAIGAALHRGTGEARRADFLPRGALPAAFAGAEGSQSP